MEKRIERRVDKKILTFFLIAFPTLLIIVLGLVSGTGSWVAQIALAFYQFILLKQYLDNYYEVLEWYK